MAFNNAVEQSKLVLGHENEHEAEKEKLFKLLLFEKHPVRKFENTIHKCRYVVKDGTPPKGSSICLSDHVMMKNLPAYDSKEAKYRPRER